MLSYLSFISISIIFMDFLDIISIFFIFSLSFELMNKYQPSFIDKILLSTDSGENHNKKSTLLLKYGVLIEKFISK